MEKQPQRIERQGDRGVILPMASIGANFREIRIVDESHTPSWKRYGQGMAITRISTHTDSRYLSLDLEEISHPNGPNKGGASSKRTMTTLDREAAQAVFDLMWDAGFRSSAEAV